MRWIVLAVCVALGGVAHGDPDAAAIERARRSVLTDEYQSVMPGQGSAIESSGSATNDSEHRERERYVDTRSLDEPGSGSRMFAWLLWGVVIVGGVVFVVWLASELLRYGGDDAAIAHDAAVPAAPDLAVIERPLGDAEELAQRGAFAEAIHTLLLRTLQELVRTSSLHVGSAMTSREILSRVPFGDAARDALAGLITAVELTHFGGSSATEADYVRCRAQFQVFARAWRST